MDFERTSGQLGSVGTPMTPPKKRLGINEVVNGFILEPNFGNDRMILSTKEEVAEYIKTYFA